MVVRLDPWQEIVNVGWPMGITHIAFSVTLNVNEHIGQGDTCSGLISAPSDPHWMNYLTGMDFSHSGGDSVSNVYVKHANTDWSSLVAAADLGVAVSGKPARPPDVAYGAWEKVGAGGAFTGNHIRGGVAVWVPDGEGADIGVPLPEGGGNFTDATTRIVDIRGGVFTGPPLAQCVSGGFTIAPCTGTPTDSGNPYDDAVSYGFDHEMSLAGVTVTHTNGADVVKTFVPLGSKLIGGTVIAPSVGIRLETATWMTLFVREDL